MELHTYPAEPMPRALAPMLLVRGDRPETRAGWVYEPKLDGFRTLAFVGNGAVRLRSRRGADMTPALPDIVSALRAQRVDVVLDGELVALDAAGRAAFDLLQRRSVFRTRAWTTEAAAPAVLVVFDVLHADGRDLRSAPYDRRRAILESVLVPSPALQLMLVAEHAESLYESALAHGHEGIVAKRTNSRYVPGRRTADWVKIKAPDGAWRTRVFRRDRR
jgi:bifunctional non-homologous end joining protein LigD